MNNLFLKGLRAVFFEIWNVSQTLVNYLTLIVELCLVYSSVLILMSFYFYGEVTFSMTANEFFTSKLFSHIVMASSVMALLVTMLRILFRTNSRKEKILWALDQKRRFSVDESVNFLRTMREFGFLMTINPELRNHQSEYERIISFLKVALSLRGVDLSQFTDDDFVQIGKFLSTNCCDDTIGIDKNKLEIFNDALPLMEILKGEIGSMTQEVSYTPSSISERTLLMEIPSICRTILLQKDAIEHICSNTLKNEDFSTYIHAVEQTSFNLIKLTNELLKEINFPPEVLKSWHEIEDLKAIATSETMNLREFYQRSNEEEK